MSENKERPPFLPLTQDQFNVVFSQMLSSLRNRDVSSPSIETSSEEEEETKEAVVNTRENTESPLSSPSSVRITQEESEATTKALIHLLEAHKILCDAVYHQLRKR